MAGAAISGLEGLPMLLSGLAKSAGELDQEMGKNGLRTIAKFAKLAPALQEELGLSSDQILQILELMIPKSLRVAFAEILVRGDVSVRQSLEVEAGLKVGFMPYVSLSAAGAFARQSSEQWGSEVRITMAALTPDTQLISDFVRRAQERDAPDGADELDFLGDLLPVLKEIFMPTGDATDPVDLPVPDNG